VTDGASLRDLPPAAREFQGIELDAEKGLTRLDAVHLVSAKDVDAKSDGRL
jgi:hypothetical protein